jgi:hypothetical protein
MQKLQSVTLLRPLNLKFHFALGYELSVRTNQEGRHDINMMNMPGFNAEYSLCKSTAGHVAALNRPAVRGVIVPAQRLVGAPATVFEPTPVPGRVPQWFKMECGTAGGLRE